VDASPLADTVSAALSARGAGLGTWSRDIHGFPCRPLRAWTKIVIRLAISSNPHDHFAMSNPELQRDVWTPIFQLKPPSQLRHLRVQVDSELMNQKANEAAVRSDYEQAHLQH